MYVCVRSGTAVGQMTTTSGLSSIASLSLGLSLSMSVSGSAAKDRHPWRPRTVTLGGQGPSPSAAKDRLMDNALQSSMSSAQASPMSGTGPARSRRSSSLVSQTMASQTQQPPSAAASSRPASTGSGGVRPAMRRQSAVSDTSADATSMGGLSPVAEQTSTGIIE